MTNSTKIYPVKPDEKRGVTKLPRKPQTTQNPPSKPNKK